MSDPQWFLLVGALMMVMGSNLSAIRALPLTSAILCLAVGVAVGPTGLDLFHFNPLEEAELLETLAEVAVLISLFAAGVKMPVPVRWPRWRAPVLLATLSMACTVALVAAFGHWILSLPWGVAVLLGAIVSPTDPVLATDIQTRHPGDRDRLRFNLTCEAGLNDGSAFPFVMLGLGLLGLHRIGEAGIRWVLVDLAWSTVAGVGVGVLAGSALAHGSWWLRRRDWDRELHNDLLGLGLIGTVYGLCELVSAWGFLAVFFAGVALRQTEWRLFHREPSSSARAGQAAEPAPTDEDEVALSESSLVYKEHLERLSEILLVLLLGGTLFRDSWSWRAVGLAAFLFLVARPVSVALGLAFSGSPLRLRAMVGWFGVRGIGSLYYLMFAIESGVPEPVALELIHLTLIVVTLSIVVHGVTVKPLLYRFWEKREQV